LVHSIGYCIFTSTLLGIKTEANKSSALPVCKECNRSYRFLEVQTNIVLGSTSFLFLINGSLLFTFATVYLLGSLSCKPIRHICFLTPVQLVSLGMFTSHVQIVIVSNGSCNLIR